MAVRWRSTALAGSDGNVRAIIRSGRNDIEVVAINDLRPVETNAHLLRYDSGPRPLPATVTVNGDSRSVSARPDPRDRDPQPAELPWAMSMSSWNAPGFSPEGKVSRIFRPAPSARADRPRRRC